MAYRPLARTIARVMKELDALTTQEQQQAASLIVARYGLPLFGQKAGMSGQGGVVASLFEKPRAAEPQKTEAPHLSSSSVSSEQETTNSAVSTKTVETTTTSEPQKKKAAVVFSAGFGKFWAAYPSKVGRDEAIRVWNKRGLEPKTDEILSGLERNRTYLMRDGGQFIPNPRTWLNQGRWMDEPRQQTTILMDKTSRNADAVRAFVERGKA